MRVKRVESTYGTQLSASIYTLSGPRKKRDRERGRNIIQRNNFKNLPKLGKEIYIQTQEIRFQDESKETHRRHMVMKSVKVKDKERMSKAARENQLVTYQEPPAH